MVGVGVVVHKAQVVVAGSGPQDGNIVHAMRRRCKVTENTRKTEAALVHLTVHTPTQHTDGVDASLG